jgi:transposase
MGHHSEAFIGIDTSKSRNAVAIAEGGRGGEVRYLGEFPATEAATRKLVAKLATKYRHLTFCYEAGPTGYGLHRLIENLGHDCMVVAPSLTPKKPGDRVKTNRRDGVSLARLARAGELTAVWVPDERHEAMRDLSRARLAAKKDLQGKRQQISSLMLRLGRYYPGKKTWGPAHMTWLMSQKLEYREQRMVLEELLQGIRQEGERVERLEQAIREAVPEWSLAEVVTALQAMRGIDLIAAVAILAEIGDLSRFQNPRELMWIPRPRTLRELHGRQHQARQYHQGRQRPGTTHPGGGGLELPVSAARGPAEAAKGGRRTEACPGDRVESANATVQALPVARAQRQAADGRRHRGCP